MRHLLLGLVLFTYFCVFMGLTGCAQGDRGAPGLQGSTGPTGATGEPGASIEAQPFCPSLNGGIGFQEQYLVIGTNVYAVYYDNKRTFLALLHPGRYITTDGRNCHFTIGSDGSVL